MGTRSNRAATALALGILLAGAGSVPAAAAMPSARTGGASKVTTSNATLSGSANPNGESTLAYFEYGQVPYNQAVALNPGSRTLATGIGAGRAGVAVRIPVSDLTPGTTYHYRLVATNSSGAGYGADRSFTTAPERPPTAQTAGASNVTATTADLSGRVDPRGARATAHFEYGPSATYGSQTPEADAGSGFGAATITQRVANLAPDTVYHYRIVVTGSYGIATGADRTFITRATPVTPVANPRFGSGGAAREIITLDTLPRRVRYGRRLRIAGHVTNPGSARTVSLEQSAPHRSGARTLAIGQLGSGGTFSFVYAPTVTASYRVVDGSTRAMSAATTVAVSPLLTLTIRTRHGIVFAGSVRPRVVPGRVLIERRAGRRWIAVAVASTVPGRRHSARYSVALRHARRGSYRAVLAATAEFAESVSETRRLRTRGPARH